MLTLPMTILVAAGLALALASLHITSVKTYLVVARIACAIGAGTGFALSVIAADVSIPDKFAVTIIGASAAALTMLVVGLVRKSSITKQREMAPEVTQFLRYHFRHLAKSDSSGNLRITRSILLEAMQRYGGNDLKVLRHAATHFQDIGHLAESHFVAMPMTQGVGAGPANVDGFLYETYAINLKDVDTYIERLSSMYVGW